MTVRPLTPGTRVRLAEPVGALTKTEPPKVVIVPAGTEGVTAETWDDRGDFNVVIDEPDRPDVDGLVCPNLIAVQVEVVA